MEIAISLNAKIHSEIRLENHRSEWRWERCTLDALLEDDRVDKVYSLFPVWSSDQPKPDKFVDGLPLDQYRDTICIFYDSPQNFKDRVFKGLIINTNGGLFGEPHLSMMRDQAKYIYGRKFVCTSGYFFDGRARQYKEILGDMFEHLPLAGVPKTYDVNNFHKDVILWPWRGIRSCVHALHPQWTSRFFQWVADKLDEDDMKEFHVVDDNPFSTDLATDFFLSSVTGCLSPYKERVKFFYSPGWQDMLDLYSNCKIAIAPFTEFTRSQMEAGAYNVPTISQKGMLFPEHLSALWNSDEYFMLMDKIYYDEKFYIETGTAYRKFIDTHHTYKVFTDNLFKILEEREMI